MQRVKEMLLRLGLVQKVISFDKPPRRSRSKSKAVWGYRRVRLTLQGRFCPDTHRQRRSLRLAVPTLWIDSRSVEVALARAVLRDQTLADRYDQVASTAMADIDLVPALSTAGLVRSTPIRSRTTD